MYRSLSLDAALGAAARPGNDVPGGMGMQGRENVVGEKVMEGRLDMLDKVEGGEESSG